MKLEKLFNKGYIGNCEIKNRLIVPPMDMNFANEDGTMTDQYYAYYKRKAQGGWGLIINEACSVMPGGKGYQFVTSLHTDAQEESHKKLVKIVHNEGAKIFCQLYHAGRQSNSYVNGGFQPVAPSAIPDPWNRQLPREITIEEIQEVVKAFGLSALRAKRAGYDGVEIHAAHGYLLAEFLSPYANKRVDEYGGSYENRIRIIREIYQEVRKTVGDDFPIQIRFSVDEAMEGGRTIAESRILAKEFEEMGFDALSVSSGVYGSYCKGVISSMYIDHGWIVDLVAEIKSIVSIPVITVNRINEPKMANQIIEMGKADFIAMGRGSLADPDLPNKAKSGQFEDIRYCIGCLQGCVFNPKGTGGCLVNPQIGNEYKEDLSKVSSPLNIMVVGGGPAGLETAYIAAKRGHHVTVYEKRNDLGGQFKSAAYPPYKGELATYTSWTRLQLKKLGVKVILNTEVTEALIQQENPDHIVLATGGVPLIPNIPGIQNEKVVTAEDVLLGNVPTGDLIVVCGGGEVGGETATALAMQEKKVFVVEMADQTLKEMDPIQTTQLTSIMNKYGVEQFTSTTVKEIKEDVLYV